MSVRDCVLGMSPSPCTNGGYYRTRLSHGAAPPKASPNARSRIRSRVNRWNQYETSTSPPATFRFLCLPPEIRNRVYEYAIFPDARREFFVFNSRVRLALLRVSRAVAGEASHILYVSRVAVIAVLPHHFYLHGRATSVDQLFRSDAPGDAAGAFPQTEQLGAGHMYPHVLARFARIRLCLFFPATFQTAYPLMFFNPIAELQRILCVLRTHLSSPGHVLGRSELEIIVSVYPRPNDQEKETETPREARVTEDFVTRGITAELRAIRAGRTLKVGGNFTREGLARFCKVACGSD